MNQLPRRLLQLRAGVLRRFATASTSSAAVKWDSRLPYKPLRPIVYTQGKYVVFNQETKGIRQMPYEIKEAAMQGTIGVVIFGLMSNVWSFLSPVVSIFLANFAFQSLRYMLHAVNKIELLEGGQKVRLGLKRGGSMVVDIAAIKKAEDEGILMTTYAEPFMFPIDVAGKSRFPTRYYIYGQGFEAMKNGELFRAIVNGKYIADGSMPKPAAKSLPKH